MKQEADNTFRDMREKSVQQWLQGMSEHEDLSVRDGVQATIDYIDDLKKQIEILTHKNEISNDYLKKLKEKKGK